MREERARSLTVFEEGKQKVSEIMLRLCVCALLLVGMVVGHKEVHPLNLIQRDRASVKLGE